MTAGPWKSCHPGKEKGSAMSLLVREREREGEVSAIEKGFDSKGIVALV
jgi:hypothetical protein